MAQSLAGYEAAKRLKEISDRLAWISEADALYHCLGGDPSDGLFSGERSELQAEQAMIAAMAADPMGAGRSETSE